MLVGAFMKKLLLSGVAIAAITVAAGMPAKAAPPSAFSWTGCYIGGNIGGGWANKFFSREPDFFDGFGPAHMSSIAGGAQIGCDVQNGMWVYGVQGMFDWTDMHGNSPFFLGKGYTTHIPWFATAAGRVGYLAQPNVLFFVKGGAAFVRDEHVWIDAGVGAFASANVTRSGWLLGGGGEWMFAPNWSVAIEYGYMGFGTRTISFQSPVSFRDNISQHVQAVLVSMNYHFGSR